MRPAPLSWLLIGILFACGAQGVHGLLAELRARAAEGEARRVVAGVDSLTRRQCVYWPPDTTGRRAIQ